MKILFLIVKVKTIIIHFLKTIKNMKEKILEILGNNHTTPCVFTSKQDVEAIYTYKNDIYCIDLGLDFPFDALYENEQKNILDAIINKEYKKDETF